MRRAGWSLVVVTGVGCGGTRPPEAELDRGAPGRPDAGAAVVAPPADAAPTPDAASAPPPDAAPARASFTIPSDPPARVKGKPVAVTEGQTVKLTGGLRVTFAHASHKHGANLGMWGFVIARGGKQVEHELRSDAPAGWQAELVAHGALLVLTHVSYTEFTVTVVPGKPRAALDDDQAMATLAEAGDAAGLPEGDAGYSADNGIGRMVVRDGDAVLWVGHVGLHTRRIWFTPR